LRHDHWRKRFVSSGDDILRQVCIHSSDRVVEEWLEE
jgi:hypothetical protein